MDEELTQKLDKIELEIIETRSRLEEIHFESILLVAILVWVVGYLR